MPMSAARAGSPPVAGRRTFDRLIVAREGGALMPMSAARAGSPPVAGRRTFDRLMAHLNRLLSGWANYLTLGQVSPACVAIDRHATRRLRQWLGRIVAREGGR